MNIAPVRKFPEATYVVPALMENSPEVIRPVKARGAMVKVSRPAPIVLVISEKPLQALFRLGIWLCVVVIFYLVVLANGAHDDTVSPDAKGIDLHEWLLLLFPIFLLPYLFNCVRVILGAGELIFDGSSQTVSRGNRQLAAFADIRALRLRAVNATCEEYCLSVELADGRHVTLLECRSSPGIDALAEEIAAMIGVMLTRVT